MSTDPRDTDRLRANRSPEEEGLPDHVDGDPPQKRSIGSQEEGIITPGDEAKATEDWGTTAAEQRAGEPQASKLDRESREGEPDVDSEGRLVADEGRTDTGDQAATASGDGQALSAEEQAVHETDNP